MSGGSNEALTGGREGERECLCFVEKKKKRRRREEEEKKKRSRG